MRITGLVSKPEHNDKLATVLCFTAATGRIGVSLEDGGKELSVKPECLEHQASAEVRGIDPKHAVAVLEQLLQMSKDEIRTDLTVVVGERRFELHGCVLMCGSEFFRTQLQTCVGAGSMREITLPEMSARAFELVVECLYTGVLSIGVSNVMELLEVSRRLQVGIAEAQCCNWLDEQLDVSNAMVVWESARRLGCEAVQVKAWPTVGQHLGEVARQEAFLTLPQQLLVELLSDDSLAVRSEVTVYEAVMGWVRWDAAGRKEAIGEVLRAVRLGLLSATYLAESVATDPLIQQSVDASRLLAEALGCHASATAGIASSSLLRRRNRPTADMGLIVLGGVDGENSNLASVECYDPSTKEWFALPDMSVARFGCAAAWVDGLLYVVGGEDDGDIVASAECYDPSTKLWRALPNMGIARYGCAAACINGLLYVVGGQDADSIYLTCVECYDPKTKKWRRKPSMSVRRYGCAASCIDGLLYVVGGDGHMMADAGALASAECYYPETQHRPGQWQRLPDMSAGRFAPAAACMDGLLYVVGKGDGHNAASAECYDPSTGTWRRLPDMSVKRYWCAVAFEGGLLYVMGGQDADHNYFKSVECYDPSTLQWHPVPDMSIVRVGCATVVVPYPVTEHAPR